MRWQIAQFVFCDQQQTLTSDNGTEQLEPMMVDLLSYLCAHPGVLLTKDQLIEEVWQGRVVTDNAVSKVVTKLRKVFADDVRQPRFIATFPKKGYKFIAQVQMIQEIVEPEELTPILETSEYVYELPPRKNNPASTVLIKLLGLVILLTVVIVHTIRGPGKTIQQPKTSSARAITAKVLTTDSGAENNANFSPDGNFMSYILFKDNQVYLRIKNLLDDSVIELTHEDGAGLGPGTWSPDGKSFVYLAATPERCEYYIRPIDGMTLGKPRLIHTCPGGSYGKISFTQDNNRVIYSENIGGASPYSLFELNLDTGIKRRLNQPELYLGGNSQFDLHPTENKLLISSPNKQQWEGFYSLDLQTNQLELLFSLDSYICCAIWSHDGRRVVMMGEHPAYELYSYALDGNDIQVIYSGSRQVGPPYSIVMVKIMSSYRLIVIQTYMP